MFLFVTLLFGRRVEVYHEMPAPRIKREEADDDDDDDAYLERCAKEGLRAQMDYERNRPPGRLVPLDPPARALMEQMGEMNSLTECGGFVTEASLQALERVAGRMHEIAGTKCKTIREAMEFKRKAVAVTRYVRVSRRRLQLAGCD